MEYEVQIVVESLMEYEVFVVVESLMEYEVFVGPLDVSPAAGRVVQLLPLQSQVSVLLSVQLSPNRVREDFVYVTMDVFPVF